MTQNDIAYALKQATNGQAFITLSQLARALGRADPQKVKRDYLMDLEAVDKKYYLIRDVASVLKSKAS